MRGGRLYIETPNSDDALLSLYECKAFADFTYWSCHVALYNVDTLSRLLKDCGFKVKKTEQIQRFPISNHLYWLSKGKPGGHNKWDIFNDSNLNALYIKYLTQLGKCDTIMIESEKI